MLEAARTAAELVNTDADRLAEIGALDRGAFALRSDRVHIADVMQSLRPTLDGEARERSACEWRWRSRRRFRRSPVIGAPAGGARARARGRVRRTPQGDRCALRSRRGPPGSLIVVDHGAPPALDVASALAQRLLEAHGATVERDRRGPGFRISSSRSDGWIGDHVALPRADFKRYLIGKPLSNERMEHERLNKKTALAVLSSDAISSVAYATDQILFVLGGAIGVAAVQYVFPISAVIVGLLVLVGISYQQTIHAYPGGGGSYTVAKENLGQRAGLIAAAALLTDYILTVAVSVSGGVAAITSAYPALVPHTVAIGVGAILLLMVVNLRGVRESGIRVQHPDVRVHRDDARADRRSDCGSCGTASRPSAVVAPLDVDPTTARHGAFPAGYALLFLLLRGFAEGCAAMTGTEAISNGVQAFKAPTQKNAAITLVVDGRDPRDVLPRRQLHGAPVRRDADDGGDGALAARAPCVRRRHRVLRAAVFDVRDPRARGEHRVRGFSAARRHPGERQVHAEPARRARRSSRVLERHHQARADRDAARLAVQGRHQRADPALRDRRVRLLHAVAGRHGDALAATRKSRGGAGGRR